MTFLDVKWDGVVHGQDLRVKAGSERPARPCLDLVFEGRGSLDGTLRDDGLKPVDMLPKELGREIIDC